MENLVYDNGNGQAVTDSLRVAVKFQKEHRTILRDIRNLLRTAQNCAVLEKRESIQSMFMETTYLNEQNKEQPMFIMNEGGFSLLAMGFTGQKAFEFKTDFLFEFQRRGQIIKSGTFSRIEIVEQNIKRRYLLRTELSEVNRNIERDMKRQREIKKELKRIDEIDFNQLQIFPRYSDHELKATFPNRRIS